MAASKKPNELYIHRVFDAPVNLVWDAWTDLKHVGNWWGPRGFTLTTHSKELRVGGQWIYTMHGPDGTDYPNIATYHAVEPCALLVYDHGATPTTPPLFHVTVTFKEVRGKTHMDMTMALATAEAAKQTAAFIKQAGGNATWDRLAEYLYEKDGHDKFVINRSFDAPIALMFDMWTNPEHLAQWLPPAGSVSRFFKGDIRTGGKGFFCMDGANGLMYGKTEYLDVSKPHRIVYRQQFCDEHQNTTRHPMAPVWPETMLTTVELTAEDEHTTRVTVTWEVDGAATAAERQMFHDAKTGMTWGWTGSFDKLDNLVTSR